MMHNVWIQKRSIYAPARQMAEAGTRIKTNRIDLRPWRMFACSLERKMQPQFMALRINIGARN
jgi:hypothetical protein